jgi:hypothetical protein
MNRVGRWNFIGDDMFECSSCGIAYTSQQLRQLKTRTTDPELPTYCPWCGSKNTEELTTQ